MKLGEVFPTNNAAVVALQNDKPALSLMKWGFPHWQNKSVIINAKSETAADKKMFAQALYTRRCIIPSTGFYEWARTDGKAKTKFRFNAPDNPMLYMAGLYTNFTSQESDEPLTERFVILTRAANSDIADVHNRMPVILYKDEIARWLRDFEFAEAVMSRDSIRLIREAA
jgi:putative SOS response-associated peptidase YedK